MMQEKKRYICIIVGINESRVLNYLSGFDGAVSFYNIHQAHKHNPSLFYETCLSQLLYRLINKNLVINTEWNGEYYYQITKKGRNLLEVIKN